MNELGETSDAYFLRECLKASRDSRDPNTRVGAVLVNPNRLTTCKGFNSFPALVSETTERLADRDLKNRLMVHAEMKAILTFARLGFATRDCFLYLAATDDSGLIWGGPPCTRCTVEIIQAGIIEVVSLPKKPVSKWHEDAAFGLTVLKEAGIKYREVTL